MSDAQDVIAHSIWVYQDFRDVEILAGLLRASDSPSRNLSPAVIVLEPDDIVFSEIASGLHLY